MGTNEQEVQEKELSANRFAALVEEIADGLDESARADRDNGFPESADEIEDTADALREYHARAQRIEAALRRAIHPMQHALDTIKQWNELRGYNGDEQMSVMDLRETIAEARAALES